MRVSPDKTLDCIGLFCPMPILKVREALKPMLVGRDMLCIEVHRQAGVTDPVHAHPDHESICYLVKGRVRCVIGDEEFVAYLRDDQFLKSRVEIGDTATASWRRDDLHLLRADLGRAAIEDSRPYQNP